MPGHDLKGVIAYRDLEDTNAMIGAATRGGKAVVIGGGLLGLEAAAGLKSRWSDALLAVALSSEAAPLRGSVVEPEELVFP